MSLKGSVDAKKQTRLHVTTLYIRRLLYAAVLFVVLTIGYIVTKGQGWSWINLGERIVLVLITIWIQQGGDLRTEILNVHHDVVSLIHSNLEVKFSIFMVTDVPNSPIIFNEATEPWKIGTNRPIDHGNMYKWKRGMTVKQKEVVRLMLRDLMNEKGYAKRVNKITFIGRCYYTLGVMKSLVCDTRSWRQRVT